MPSIAASALRTHFSETVNRVAQDGERLVLERRGKPVAVLVPVEDLALLEELEDRQDYEEGMKALIAVQEGREKTIPLEEVKRSIGL